MMVGASAGVKTVVELRVTALSAELPHLDSSAEGENGKLLLRNNHYLWLCHDCANQ